MRILGASITPVEESPVACSSIGRKETNPVRSIVIAFFDTYPHPSYGEEAELNGRKSTSHPKESGQIRISGEYYIA